MPYLENGETGGGTPKQETWMSKALRYEVHGMFQKAVCSLLLLEYQEVWGLEENETGK